MPLRSGLKEFWHFLNRLQKKDLFEGLSPID
jgi:hypothetical protein